ncbi:putative lipoprotein [Bordetella pertussis STO1-CHOC-0018]|nr:putative lipoprotein [Bordetella pertussis STO1-CHOC-0018]
MHGRGRRPAGACAGISICHPRHAWHPAAGATQACVCR